MISRFFIYRPVFAVVLSIVITLAGGVFGWTLPIAQYPEIVPPTVQVTASYPGADARVVADTVAAPIEQQVNGVERMLYMSSQCANNGSYTLTVTFELGTELGMAMVLVQNRVQLAMAKLPETVQRQCVNVIKQSPSITLAVNLVSDRKPGSDAFYHSQFDMSNFATIQVRDRLARLRGVGTVNYLGQQDYSMRVWLDPQKLASRDLVASDVVNAIRGQNVQVAAGVLGQQPAPRGQELQLVLTAQGRLTTEEQFGDIVVKAGKDGRLVRIRDVARVELGAQNQDVACSLNGDPSVALAIFQLPGTNALETAEAVRHEMEQLRHSKQWPVGLRYEIVYDTTVFTEASIEDVFLTLGIAIVLVAVVVLAFLQNWRATLIPLVAVPVSIVGTFAVMAALGFSLNNLSLFGLVLAIGIVVDDAIVVVENVERWLEHGLPPKEAAARAMDEVTGPVIATTLVLCAVFVPCAFISGITGQFFRQFAVTIAVSTAISAFNSLTLSPALASLLLAHREHIRDPLTRLLNLSLGWFFVLFNRAFDWVTAGYVGTVRGLLRASVVALAVYAGLLVATWYAFTHTPTGFIPDQDQGYLLVNLQLPDAASVGRTREAVARVGKLAKEVPGVRHTLGIAGQSMLLNAVGSNFGSMFVILDDFGRRRSRPEEYDAAVAGKLREILSREVPEARVAVFRAPPVQGLGTAGGYQLQLQYTGGGAEGVVGGRGSELTILQGAAESLIAKANAPGTGLVGNFTTFRADTPQMFVDIDREKARQMGVPLENVFDTLSINLGSVYVNDLNLYGRTWQVNVQAEADYRSRPEDLQYLKVRNALGAPVPLGTLARVTPDYGPALVQRYNMFPSAQINGSPLPGVSSGQAVETIQELCDRTLPTSVGYEWTGLTYQEIKAGNTALLVFLLATVLVFLVLAAQYESWTLPLAVILVVPMCLLCAVLGVWVARLPIDIFVQIGLVVLIGLASKNAILIVEFAKQQREAGKTAWEATLEACKLRLRPILMTSFAFILGVLPLVIAKGAGAEMRRSLGTAVFAGMLGVTLFGIFLTPVFYFSIEWLLGRKPASADAQPATPPATAGHETRQP